MRVLSLFSGIGGIDLGLEWAGMQVTGQIEIDEYCQTILEKNFPKAKRWRDITSVTAHDIRRHCGAVELICGGFPCQDISVAGKGRGASEGEKSGLWREMWRIIGVLRPAWLLIENVPALRLRGADSVLSALEAIGYTCWPVVVGAWAVGAPHKRDRVWIVAHANSEPVRKRGVLTGLVSRNQRQAPSIAFPACQRSEQREWELARSKPAMGSTADGIPSGLALKAIGNSVVPQIPYLIGKWIMQAHE